ncbi:MAG: hypothetical protein LBG11_09285 [Bifidobacteriaceae bacterium]|jgi:hypothetical protein|nr:hypothetical protein [Bifidobacteriaceae bacterium]
MNDKPVVVTTLEDSIRGWPDHFKDFVDGKDVASWIKMAFTDLAPPLFGQSARGLTMGSVLEPEEIVRYSWPAFLDNDPAEAPAPAGAKVKPHGKWAQGLMVVTDRSIAFSREVRGPLHMVFAVRRERIVAANQLKFAFSLLSTSAASDGYELLFREPDGSTGRILFRVALEIKNPDRVRAALQPKAGPEPGPHT